MGIPDGIQPSSNINPTGQNSSAPKDTDHIQSIPDEILESIFSYVGDDPQDVKNVTLTSRRFKGVEIAQVQRQEQNKVNKVVDLIKSITKDLSPEDLEKLDKLSQVNWPTSISAIQSTSKQKMCELSDITDSFIHKIDLYKLDYFIKSNLLIFRESHIFANDKIEIDILRMIRQKAMIYKFKADPDQEQKLLFQKFELFLTLLKTNQIDKAFNLLSESEPFYNYVNDRIKHCEFNDDGVNDKILKHLIFSLADHPLFQEKTEKVRSLLKENLRALSNGDIAKFNEVQEKLAVEKEDTTYRLCLIRQDLLDNFFNSSESLSKDKEVQEKYYASNILLIRDDNIFDNNSSR